MKLLGESCLSLSPPLHRASQYPPVHAPTPSRWKPLLPFLMLSLMLGGTTQACYLPDRPSVAEQAYHSPVVVEGKVQGTGKAVAGAHVRFSLAVRVTDVWSTRNDDLSRGSILMVGDFGSEAPCIRPRRNQRYIFFLQPPTLSTSLASLEPSSTSAYSPSSLPSLQSLMVSSSHSPSFIASDSPPSLHTFRPTPNTVNGSQSAWPVAENTSDAPATGRPRHGDEGHWRGAVYRSLYAPRESVSRGHNVKRQVNSILCEQCAMAPRMRKKLKTLGLKEGDKLTYKCEARAHPRPEYRWYRDGVLLKKGKGIRIKMGKRTSRLQINKVKLSHEGEYSCEAFNFLGTDEVKGKVTVSKSSTPSPLSSVPPPGSGHSRVCNDSERAYCVNGGRCYVIEAAGMYQLSCQCPTDFTGHRCQTSVMASFYRHLGLEFAVKIPKTSHLEAEELYQKRVLTITGICIALLVVGIMCVVAYCKTKKQRQRLHNHLRHGMHAMNVNPPNGPHNQPQPPPSPAPAPDNSIQLRNIGASPSQYVQKNPGSDEHQLSRDTDCSFSTSHHSTTPTTSSRHNCRQCWGSGQSDESASMETNSGPLTTTGSSSRETSRPAAQCPAPRGHISAVSGPPDGRIRCDSHDLPDSPLSDRYVSAVTTPSRSSPVDILFPRHNGLLIDIPPGLRSPRPMSGSPKLWRQRGRPDLIRGGSSSSIPPSPAQFLEEEEYETTQEYEFSAPMSAPLPPTSSAPSSTNMGKGRAMRRNGKRRNGGAGIMGLGPSSTNVIMSSSTELSIGSSGGESEGESDFEIGENTPFLGIPLSLTSAGHSSFTPVGDGITFPGSAISGHSLAGPCVLPARLAYPLARATTGNGRQDSVSSVITTSQFSSEEELRMAGCTRALRDRDPIAV